MVELFVPEEIYGIIATTAAPEVMVRPIVSYDDLLKEPIDVWAIGPGLGQARPKETLELIRAAKAPMVLDADGLNILAEKMDTLGKAQGPRLLTPHPGEMKRLFSGEGMSRAEIATPILRKIQSYAALERQPHDRRGGASSAELQTTGNPGMATGGMGDVLTGVCAALLGARLSTYDAARLGAWLCGRAAELAISTRARQARNRSSRATCSIISEVLLPTCDEA